MFYIHEKIEARRAQLIYLPPSPDFNPMEKGFRQLGGELSLVEQPTSQQAEPDFHLIKPEGMFGRVDEPDAVTDILQKGHPAGLALQNAGAPLFVQIVGDPTLLGHEPHQGLELVGVELIAYKEPGTVRVSGQGGFDVLDEIGFGAAIPNTARDLAGGHVEAGDEGLSPVAYGLDSRR
jgi:hypothetical protein